MSRLCILGGGRMGSALLGGLLASEYARPEEFVVVDPHEDARALVARTFPGVVVDEQPRDAEAVVLAMKPADAETACRSLPSDTYERVLSIAAGVTITSLESWLWPGAVVLRAMPNTPALVGEAATAVAGGRAANEADFAWAETVLSSVGVVVRLDESQLDAVTGLSGSGPAYVFYLAEALEEAGVAQGLDPEVARQLTIQTLFGAATMLRDTGERAADLRAAVTSPRGTTEAGIAELDERAVREAFLAAVARATRRSEELGKGKPAASGR